MKTMKNLRKMVSLFITVCMAVGSLATSVSAEDNFEPLAFNTLDEYIEYSIPRHLYAQQMETSEVLEYSNPIALYDFANNTVVGSEVFLIDNGQLIGKIDIYGDINNYSSYFDTYITDEMREAYMNEKNIAIGGYEDSVLLYTDTEGFAYVNGLESNNMPNNVPTELTSIKVGGNVQSDFPMMYSIATVKMSVPHVDNSNTYDSSGQCWAAAVSMKLNYHFNLGLTADSVYEKLTAAGINFQSDGTGKALTHFGYSDYVGQGIAMTSGDVTLTLQNKKPIIMHVSANSGRVSHAIVISGIVLDASSSTYTINDPNYPATRTLITSTNPSVVNSNINYKSTGYTFDKWYNTYY